MSSTFNELAKYTCTCHHCKSTMHPRLKGVVYRGDDLSTSAYCSKCGENLDSFSNKTKAYIVYFVCFLAVAYTGYDIHTTTGFDYFFEQLKNLFN